VREDSRNRRKSIFKYFLYHRVSHNYRNYPRYKDLVVSTFSGKVLGFTADPAARDATGATMVNLCPEGGANASSKGG
jgi:hypothetical protein